MIDIIIPAYNSHNTIQKTLYSILMQTIKDKVKVYIVNDGSNKDYSDIIKKFKNYLKVEELKLEQNRGTGFARNYGIKNSNSTYIIFIDSDDIFYNEYSLETLYNKINENNYDLIISNFLEEIDINNYIAHNDNKLWNHGKIYKRSFIENNNILFLEQKTNEDLYFNFLLFAYKPNVEYIEDTTYIWKNNPNSLTRNIENNYIKNSLNEYNKAINLVINRIEEKNLDKSIGASILFFSNLQMYYTYLSLKQNNDLETIKKLLQATKLNRTKYIEYEKYLTKTEKNRIISMEISKYIGINMETFILPNTTFETFLNYTKEGDYNE